MDKALELEHKGEERGGAQVDGEGRESGRGWDQLVGRCETHNGCFAATCSQSEKNVTINLNKVECTSLLVKEKYLNNF